MVKLHRRAFTLIEVVVTLVIIGILASIALVGYSTVIDRAHATAAETSAASVSRRVIVDAVLDESRPLASIFDEASANNDFSNLSVTLLDSSGAEVDEAGDLSRSVNWDTILLSGGAVRVCTSDGWFADTRPDGALSGSLSRSSRWSVSEGQKGCGSPLADSLAPSPPSISATPDDSSAAVLVSGILPAEGVSDIEYSLDSGATWTSVGLSTSFTIPGLMNDVPVNIVARSVNAFGFSSPSNEVTVVPSVPAWELTSPAPLDAAAYPEMVSEEGFGFDVRLSADGTRFVAGGNDAASSERHGLYVYAQVGSDWEIISGRLASKEYAAMNLDISGDGKTVIGASYYKGTLEIFQESAGTWSKTQTLTCSDFSSFCTQFGNRARISDDGSMIAVTAGTSRLFLFERSGSTYSLAHTQNLSTSSKYHHEGAYGMALSADGTSIALYSASLSADVFVLDFDTSVAPWTVTRTNLRLGTWSSDIDSTYFPVEFVDISNDGNRVALVNYTNSTIEVYDRGSSSWSAPATINGSGSSFGWALALSGDGSTVAVGQPTSATTFVFKESSPGSWTPLLDPVAGHAGKRVGLSDDGSVLLTASVTGVGMWSTGGKISVFSNPLG